MFMPQFSRSRGKVRFSSLLLALLIVPASSRAGTVIVDHLLSGWWSSDGLHPANNDTLTGNYMAGFGGTAPGRDHHDYFVADLTGITTPIGGAVLRISNPSSGYSSPDPVEVYSLFDVSTSVASLTSLSGNALAKYTDLGAGVIFGSRTVSAADNGAVVEVVLNAAGIAALNNALGGQFAIGGALTSLRGAPAEYAFAFTGSSGDLKELVLTQVPEPAMVWLVPAGLAVVALARKRRQAFPRRTWS